MGALPFKIRKYPQLRALEDRNLFLSGKLMGAYGIVWSDELDLEVETVYEDGQLVRQRISRLGRLYWQLVQERPCRKSN